MIGEDIILFFQAIGAPGLVIAFAVISFLDGLTLPTLPEAWLVFIAMTDIGVPILAWAVILIAAGTVSSVSAQYLLYRLIKRFGLPRRIQRAMNRYTEFLIISDEKLAFTNWIAPVIPFVGAFVAVCKWRPKLAFAYATLGGLLKMSIIVIIAVVFKLQLDPATAANASIAFVVIILVASLLSSYLGRKHMQKKKENIEKEKTDPGQAQ